MASLAFNDDGERMTAERFARIIINYTRFAGIIRPGSQRINITMSNRRSTLFLREEVSAAINALYNRYRRATNFPDEIVSTVLTIFFGNEIVVNRMQIIQVINALEEHTRAIGGQTFLEWVQTNLQTNVDAILMQGYDNAPNLQVIRDDTNRRDRERREREMRLGSLMPVEPGVIQENENMQRAIRASLQSARNNNRRRRNAGNSKMAANLQAAEYANEGIAYAAGRNSNADLARRLQAEENARAFGQNNEGRENNNNNGNGKLSPNEQRERNNAALAQRLREEEQQAVC